MLNKEQILAAKDIKSEVVKCPEWGGEVLVMGLTLAEKDKWQTSIIEDGKVNMEGATARLCALSMRDDDGGLMFADSDVIELSKKAATPLDRIFQVAQKLSGLGAGEVEEVVKNSEATQTEDSN